MVLQPNERGKPSRRGTYRKRDSYPTQDELASPWKAEGTQSRLPFPSGSRKNSSKSESDIGLSLTVPKQDDLITVDPAGPMPLIRTEHRDKASCPCNKSITSSWKLDCHKCKQYWHADCVGLSGISQSSINKLSKWSCPLCWVSPVSTMKFDVNVCHVCKNTLTLQQTNLEYEASLSRQKIQNISSCCNVLNKVNFEQLRDQVDTLSEFDQHLKHLLLSSQSLKSLDTEMKKLSDLLASSTLHSEPHNDATLQTMNSNISKLLEDLANLASKDTSTVPQVPDSTHEILNDLNKRLEKLTETEALITTGMQLLTQSIEKSHLAPNNTPAPASHSTSPSSPRPPSTPVLPEPSYTPIEHQQVPYTDCIADFTEQEEAVELTRFLESCTFKQENGHSVLSFGESYQYIGSKSSSEVPPIPDTLKPFIDRINSLQAGLYSSKFPQDSNAPQINSCLINRYEGPNSFLPRHSDNEVTIHPESSIFTLSIGQSSTINFIEQQSGSETELTCPGHSLYHMTRRSQEVFDHFISKGSIESGIRYSLTFRCVSWKNKNSTCLLGDSNTGLLKFGSDKRGTFGELMPGHKFWAPRIKDIDPVSCMGYANVVLLCGINDIRQPDVMSKNDVASCYYQLKLKIRQIKQLSPSTKAVFVCRLLPTKDNSLNMKVDTFNRMLYFDLIPSCKYVVYVGGFERFAHNHVLADDLSKQYDRHGRPDILHLNKSGARVLAGLIKRSIFFRLNGGVDRRRFAARVDGRLYSNVASAPTASQRTR